MTSEQSLSGSIRERAPGAGRWSGTANAPHVLVVDDEPAITELIALYLDRGGYRFAVANDGNEAARLLEDSDFDLVILDIMMPGPDGLELLRTVRARDRLPVILVSARSSDVDKIAGLHLGADDYVTKPFSPSELIARVESVLRRTGRSDGAPASLLRAGDLTIDTEARVAAVGERVLSLTPREFELLAVLCRFAGVALSRDKLLDVVWGSKFYGIRTVDIHVLRLRKKLSGGAVEIGTVWGSGYRLDVITGSER